MNTQAFEKKFIGPIAIDSIVESKLNPRKAFGDLDDLASSIKAKGIISPILVRELPGDNFEIVYGARRVRAAEKAGLKEVPAFLTECSEEEAQELRIIENAQRADVHPLHEAQAIQKLFDKAKGVEIDQVAARLGRTPAYIRRRLELLLLPPAAKLAFLEGKMVLGVAQLIAGIGTESSRIRAWETVENYEGCLTDPVAARQEIRSSVLPELDGATWKLSEEGIAGAVACLRCPHRTAAQVDLFGSTKGSGHCLEPKCFQAKTDAAYVTAEKAFQASGQGTVLTAKECKKLFPYGGDRPANEWLAASDTHWTGTKSVGVSVLMKGKEAKRFLAKGPDGEAIVLYRRKDVDGEKTKAKKTTKQAESSAKAKREDELELFLEGHFETQMLAAASHLGAVEFLALIGNEIVGGDTDDLECEPFKNSMTAKAFARHEVPNLAAFKASVEIVKQRIYRDVIFGRHVDTSPMFEEELGHALPALGLNLKELKKSGEKAFALAEKAKADAKPAVEKPKKGKKR